MGVVVPVNIRVPLLWLKVLPAVKVRGPSTFVLPEEAVKLPPEASSPALKVMVPELPVMVPVSVTSPVNTAVELPSVIVPALTVVEPMLSAFAPAASVTVLFSVSVPAVVSAPVRFTVLAEVLVSIRLLKLCAPVVRATGVPVPFRLIVPPEWVSVEKVTAVPPI